MHSMPAVCPSDALLICFHVMALCTLSWHMLFRCYTNNKIAVRFEYGVAQ